MISKKLIHQVVAFLNNYLGNANIITGYTYYGSYYIRVYFAIWSTKNDHIQNQLKNYDRYIENENDFNKFKEEITNNINKDLDIARQKSITDETSYKTSYLEL